VGHLVLLFTGFITTLGNRVVEQLFSKTFLHIYKIEINIQILRTDKLAKMTEPNVRYANENIIKLQNPVIQQWEISLNENLYNRSLSIQTRCSQILQQLYLIRQADEQNGTSNYCEILCAQKELLEIILETAAH
jgi:hypothetical protein